MISIGPQGQKVFLMFNKDNQTYEFDMLDFVEVVLAKRLVIQAIQNHTVETAEDAYELIIDSAVSQVEQYLRGEQSNNTDEYQMFVEWFDSLKATLKK